MKKLDDEGRDVPRSLTKAAKPCLNNAWFSCMSTDKKRVVNPFSLPAVCAHKFAIAVSKTCHPVHKKFVHAKAMVTPAFCRVAAKPSVIGRNNIAVTGRNNAALRLNAPLSAISPGQARERCCHENEVVLTMLLALDTA
jgi:hypothetical protein